MRCTILGPRTWYQHQKKIKSKGNREIEDEAATTSREIEKGNSSKISTENLISKYETLFCAILQ